MLAETFSQEATRLLGAERWARWGSEQVASNMLVTNDPNALLLPYDNYFNFWDEGMPEDARLVHFIGSCRLRGDRHGTRLDPSHQFASCMPPSARSKT